MEAYTLPLEEILDMVYLAEEHGYTQDEALSLLAKYNLIEDSDDDMD